MIDSVTEDGRIVAVTDETEADSGTELLEAGAGFADANIESSNGMPVVPVAWTGVSWPPLKAANNESTVSFEELPDGVVVGDVIRKGEGEGGF